MLSIHNKNPSPIVLPRIVVPESTASEQWLAKIQEVYESVAKALLTFWLTMQYYIESSMSPGAEDARDLFKDGRIVGFTQNRGKLEDIPVYVHLREENALSSHVAEIAKLGNLFGLCTEQADLQIHPFGSGKCLGSSILFCKDWLETGNIEETAEKFKDGVPLLGVTYQNVYKHFSNTYHFSETTSEQLLSFLETYPKEKNKPLYYQKTLAAWKQAHGPKTSTIVEAAKAFLDAAQKPREGLLRYICNYLLKEKNLALDGVHYSTVRKSVEAYEQKDSLSVDQQRAICSLAKLNIEEVVYHNTTPQVIAQGLSSLNSGAYILGIPTYNFFGQKDGAHALSLIVDESKNYYFLDPNYGIGAATEKQSSAMFNRIYQNYGNYREPLFNLYRVDQYQSKAERS